MKTIFHPESGRGKANHGWLEAAHSFSFAGWQDPSKVHFGALRVLNDDRIAGGRGFGRHPHDNMEIITIPLEGALEHQDSMGNRGIIQAGDVQVMSAGTGVTHSEFNANADLDCRLFQIWLFPKMKGVEPRYDQQSFPADGRKNGWQLLVSPHPGEEGAMWIHQDAWISMGQFDAGQSVFYEMKRPGNGLYALVVSGEINIGDQKLGRRDALGIWETDQPIGLKMTADSEILLLDVPMSW